MTSDPIFVDTNVLIYARDDRVPEKMQRAQAWLLGLGANGTARINMQVLDELTRWILKNEARRASGEIRDEIEALRIWGEKPLASEEHGLAWVVRDVLGYQWFDCLLIAAAHVQGCRYVLTEDMGHGATFQGLTLIDPFRVSPDELLLRN